MYFDGSLMKTEAGVGLLFILPLRVHIRNKGRHKLTPPWEGPYIIAQVLKPETYKLANEKGEIFTDAWNIEQLRRFYP